MIMGFAAAARAWFPTIKALFARGEKSAGIEVVVYDNRGIGASSVPAKKAAYTTDVMAQDALGIMDPASGRRIKDLLVEEYMGSMKTHGMQSQAGEEGHLNAVMKHGLSGRDKRTLAAAHFPIKVIHGAADILALPRHAARLALQLGAPLVVDELLSSIEAVRGGATHADTVHSPADPAAYMGRGGCLCCA
ncbi:hypothetical protein GPECTOR_27g652 [Gonium pectorale]|uniref:AB hydrolase-1 domain-containing protein n=1 Tax=Gonium pectorale TaxID=33097 RepID=A0A150GF62_GONPE|nr:hypothetical protein GPECTOR_27g652 [Gonium pectorale]|eukprot:KXZ48482.1 hypothetical protein GPECTOR_27g652 [Gonium pectorale]